MKVVSCILGGAIGDALGRPFEFQGVESIKKANFNGSMNHGSDLWKLKPGQYTDDSKMLLAISLSLIDKKGFDPQDLCKRYIAWVDSGDLRGIGQQTEKAIKRLKQGIASPTSGFIKHDFPITTAKRITRVGSDPLTGIGNFCGNGTVMRAAPFGIYFKNDRKQLEIAARTDATITHDHADARDSSHAIAEIVANIVSGMDLTDAIVNTALLKFEGKHISTMILNGLTAAADDLSYEEASVKLGWRGTAHETLGSAVYCVLNTDNFKDAVVTAVKMGGDTDTRASVAGVIAGAYYGLEGIPFEYVEQVEDSTLFQTLDKLLMNGPE